MLKVMVMNNIVHHIWKMLVIMTVLWRLEHNKQNKETEKLG